LKERRGGGFGVGAAGAEAFGVSSRVTQQRGLGAGASRRKKRKRFAPFPLHDGLSRAGENGPTIPQSGQRLGK